MTSRHRHAIAERVTEDESLNSKSWVEQSTWFTKRPIFDVTVMVVCFIFGTQIIPSLHYKHNMESRRFRYSPVDQKLSVEDRLRAGNTPVVGSMKSEEQDHQDFSVDFSPHLGWRNGVKQAQTIAMHPEDWAEVKDGTIFMVRTVDPTAAMLERILAWAIQLRGVVLRFVILVDLSKSDEVLVNISNAVISHPLLEMGRDVHIFSTSNEELRRAYPHVDDVKFPSVTKRGHWATRGPVYWFFVECLSAWYQSLSSPLREQIKNIWLLEDDVGWSGDDIGDLVRDYANNTCDLATVNAARHPKKPGPSGSWMFTNASTVSFAEWAPRYEDRYSTRLQVQRYSSRYLKAAHILATVGIIAVSELSSASILHRLQLTYCDMLGRSSGIPYLSYTRINPELWEKLRSKARRENKPRFYHALKW